LEKLKLFDIANALGISKTTVSKVLNNYSDVNQFTRIKVLDYIKKVGFEPNRQASFLRTKKIKTVALILPRLENDFFNKIQEGILKVSQEHDYSLCVATSYDCFETEKKLVSQFLNRNVDAIFLSISHQTINFDHLIQIQKQGKILVLFDKIEKTINCPKVIIDDRKASFIATEHLIKNGCKQILHFRSGYKPQISIDRYLGYRDALNKYHLPFDKEKVIVCEITDEKNGFLAAKKAFELGIKIDGLLAGSDHAAIGAIQFFKNKKLSIPKDISVVGFGNWKLSKFITPSLTTVDQSAPLMGEEIFKIFLEEKLLVSRGEAPANRTLILSTNLIVRESSIKSLRQDNFN
jgi:LacI family transcriptional regulator